MPRLTQSALAAVDPEIDEPRSAAPARPTAAAPLPQAEHRGFDGLRAEIQRRMAASLDPGEPEPAAAEPVERIAIVPPRPQRQRIETLRREMRHNTTVRAEPRSFLPPGLRGRLPVRPSRLILVAIALLAGGAAAYLATQHTPTPSAAEPLAVAAPQIVPEARAQILVATKAIGMGDRLSATSVGWADWPEGALRADYITEQATPGAIAEMAGAAARFEFFPGEPIRKEKLALPGDGYLSVALAKGMRGVSVAVAAESASGGFVVPNDHVDVMVTRTLDNRTVASTILNNVKVLAINKRLGETGATGAPPAAADGSNAAEPADPAAKVFSDTAIATLELTPTEAEVITAAASTGKLSLVLRGLDDVADASADRGATATANEAIRLTSPFWTTAAASAAPTPR